IYQVTGNPAEGFTVTVGTTPTSTTVNRTGGVLMPKVTGGYTVKTVGTTSTLSIDTGVNHNLVVGDHVWMDFPTGELVDSEFAVASVIDEDHFTVTGTSLASFTDNSTTIYPLVSPPIVRS